VGIAAGVEGVESVGDSVALEEIVRACRWGPDSQVHRAEEEVGCYWGHRAARPVSSSALYESPRV